MLQAEERDRQRDRDRRGGRGGGRAGRGDWLDWIGLDIFQISPLCRYQCVLLLVLLVGARYCCSGAVAFFVIFNLSFKDFACTNLTMASSDLT